MALSIQIVIDVSGESQGSPGVARTFPYSRLAGPPIVTLSLADTSGVTSYSWGFIDIPEGSSAVLSSATVPTPTFSPDIQGTYLVQCTVNDGQSYARNAVAFTTEFQAFRMPAAGETVEFDPITGWKEAVNELFERVDVGISGAGSFLDIGGAYAYVEAATPIDEVVAQKSFDGSDAVAGSLVLKAVVTPSLSTGSCSVMLYDMGPVGTPSAARLVSTLTTSTNGGPQVLEQALTVVDTSPGTNEILSADHVYELRVTSAAAQGDSVYIGGASIEVV